MDGAGLPPVADARQRVYPPLDQLSRRLHVHDLGRAGVAERPGAAHDEKAVLVDL
jgi:hypothetical protein